MGKRDKLSDEAISAFLASHAGWARVGGEGSRPALEKTFSFKDFGGALAFAVRVGLAAEKHDHHPDLLVKWGKVQVTWSTHDTGGVTQMDTGMVEETDKLFGGG